MNLLRKLWGYMSYSHALARIRRSYDECGSAGNELPLPGFEDGRLDSGFVEFLADNDLLRLNQLLPWKCFTVDAKGRRFGNRAWEGKREIPQVIPDPRIMEMNRMFGLKGKTVLEVGCFEGVHTIGLAQVGAQVHAIDARIENVVKTLVRTNMFGFSPRVCVCDLEVAADVARLPRVNYVHHVGVLYHLKDPVTHLLSLGDIANDGMLLDTHYATKEMLTGCYAVCGKYYQYYKYGESGRGEVFSGMYDHAKWLLLEDVKEILAHVGLTEFRIINDSTQRNGPRITALVARPGTIESQPSHVSPVG